MRTIFLSLILAALAAADRAGQRAPETLTVYTYESFTAEWGPGPQVEKAFEAECGCDLKFVSVADGVALLNRVKLEGAVDQGRHRARPRHQSDGRSQGDRPVRAAGIDQSALSVPGGWSDDIFVPFDYGYFAVVYDTEKLKTPPKSLQELVDGDPDEQDRHPGSAHLDAGARPAALGEGGLWRQGAGSLGEAEAARAHRDAGLERGLRPVHQGRGADGAVLHHLAGLPHRSPRAPSATRRPPSRKATICRSRWPA